MPHYVASDLGLHCLPMTLLGFLGKNGLIHFMTYLLLFCIGSVCDVIAWWSGWALMISD